MNVDHGIIVGAYPSAQSKAFGGVIYNCDVLKMSPLYQSFIIHELDTTQLTIPPPSVFIRLFLSFIRIFKLLILLLKLNLSSRKPKFMLLFTGRGFSFLEKSFYSFISRPFVHITLLYPLGPRLIDDCQNSHLQTLFVRLSSNFSTFILCQGRPWFNFFTSHCHLASSKLFTLPSWTSTPDLQSKFSSVHARVSQPISDPIFVYSGWLVENKGVIELINAFHSFVNEGYPGSLTLIGDGPLHYRLKSFVTKYSLSNRVSFLGRVSHSFAINYLANHADIFVLPSYKEGIPNSLIESTSIGIPSIVTDVGCISDYYDSQSCLFIPSHSVDSIYSALVSMLSSTCRKKFSANGHIAATRSFSTKAVVEKLIHFINTH